MLLDGFISLLTGTPAVNNLATGGVFKSVLPRGYALPAIAVHRYDGTQDYQFDGPVGVREDMIQFDVYGATAEAAQQVAEAVRTALVGYTGTLPDGSIVQAVYLERDMDMPFLPHADSKGIANRSLLGFRVVSQR